MLGFGAILWELPTKSGDPNVDPKCYVTMETPKKVFLILGNLKP